jgi:sugar phosphate isomerase/epimerase
LKSKSTPYQDTIGLQLWTVRDQMVKAPQATLKAIKSLGYHQVELEDTRTAKELLPICNDLGLKVNSSFMLWTALTGRWDLVPHETKKLAFDEVLDQASEAGLSHLVFGYLLPGERETLDDYRRLVDVLNEAGMQAKQRGIQMAYHNHNFEFEQLDGGVPFELMIERFDKDLMPFELDVFWAAISGYDPVKLLNRIADRTKLLHLKDLKQGIPVMTTTEGVPEDAFQELGDGTLPIKELAMIGKKIGVDYCFVEQDESPDPMRSIRESIKFYRELKMVTLSLVERLRLVTLRL